MYLKQYFNSIKVRLELSSTSNDDKLLVFQFHKGAIRTNNYLYES